MLTMRQGYSSMCNGCPYKRRADEYDRATRGPAKEIPLTLEQLEMKRINDERDREKNLLQDHLNMINLKCGLYKEE